VNRDSAISAWKKLDIEKQKEWIEKANKKE
jgi:hypothetical protein